MRNGAKWLESIKLRKLVQNFETHSQQKTVKPQGLVTSGAILEQRLEQGGGEVHSLERPVTAERDGERSYISST